MVSSSLRAGLLCCLTLVIAAASAAEPGEGSLFRLAGPAVGLDFVHDNGMTGELYLPEVTGSGAGLVDFDGDGDLDLYLVQGGPLGPDTAQATRPSDRLFRNDAGPGGALRLVDVTEEARLAATGYGMGVAVADVDGDGFQDLYLANLGSNQLWRNRGDGTFVDMTEAAGVDDSRWSVVPVFFDQDGDGDPDLYVGNYVDFSYARHRKCDRVGGAPDYCGPLAYSPVTDRLFRNRGNGTFEDVSHASGIGTLPGNTLGAVASDLDGDGKSDLYVANDMTVNFLWSNRGDGTFREDGLLAGVALNREGQAEASMGIAIGDFDGDLDEDLFLTHLNGETNTLYRNLGAGSFRDDTIPTGLGPPSFDRTGFGTAFLDADGDGFQDLVVVNGAVRTLENQALAGEPYPLKQADQLFLGNGETFEDATDRAGSGFHEKTVSRGLAVGDVDLDGSVDLLVNDNRGPARLLLGVPGGNPLELRLETPGRSPRVGTVVLAHRSAKPPLRRRVHTDGSYASASSPRLSLFPGTGRSFSAIEIRWPSGDRQRLMASPDSPRIWTVPPRERP